MFGENALKKRLAAGKKALGCWLVSNDPMAAEMVGLAGYDFALIDHEHGPGDLMGAIGQTRALGRFETTCVMRVPWNDMVYVKRALDSGMEGIMVPYVENAEEARAAVAACRYAPAGNRGCAIGAVRATGFGKTAKDYWERIQDNLLIILQVETPTAVDNIPEIAAVEGVDVLFIGPNDLCNNMGRMPGAVDDEVAAVLDRAEAAIKDAGKYLASVPHRGRSPMDMFAAGYDIVTGGSDMSLLRIAGEAQVAAHREANG